MSFNERLFLSMPGRQRQTRLLGAALLALGTAAVLVLSGCGGGTGGTSKNGSPTVALSPTPEPAAATRGQVHFSIAWPTITEAAASRGRLIPKVTQRIDVSFVSGDGSNKALTILNVVGNNNATFSLRSVGTGINNVLTVTRPASPPSATLPSQTNVSFDLPTGSVTAAIEGFDKEDPAVGGTKVAVASASVAVVPAGANLDISLVSTIQKLVVNATANGVPVGNTAANGVLVGNTATLTASAYDGDPAAAGTHQILTAPGDISYTVLDPSKADLSAATDVGGPVIFTGKKSTYSSGNPNGVGVVASVQVRNDNVNNNAPVTSDPKPIAVKPYITLGSVHIAPVSTSGANPDGPNNAQLYQNGDAAVSAVVVGANNNKVDYTIVGYPVSAGVQSSGVNDATAQAVFTVPITGDTSSLNYTLSAKLLETGDTVSLPAFTVIGITFAAPLAVNDGSPPLVPSGPVTSLLEGDTAHFSPGTLSGVKLTTGLTLSAFSFATVKNGTTVSTTNSFAAPYAAGTYATTATGTITPAGGTAISLLSAALNFTVPDVAITTTSALTQTVAAPGTVALNAAVSGALNTSVDWNVVPPATPKFTVTVSASGVVTAADDLGAASGDSQPFTIKATSQARPDKLQTFVVTVTKP